MADTTSAAPSLLPCPFCGGDARHDAHADDCYFILHRKFKNSGADMSPAFDVLEAWNRRAPQPVVLKLEEIYSIYLKSGLGKFHLSDGVMECEYERCIYDFARGIEKAIRGIGTEKGDSNG